MKKTNALIAAALAVSMLTSCGGTDTAEVTSAESTVSETTAATVSETDTLSAESEETDAVFTIEETKEDNATTAINAEIVDNLEQPDWLQAYTDYLNKNSFLAGGILLQDITGDSIPELIVQLNPNYNTDIIYYFNGDIEKLNLIPDPMDGGIVYIADAHQILFIDCYDMSGDMVNAYLYEWTGTNYAVVQELHQEYETGNYYINDELVEKDVYDIEQEKLNKFLTENEYFEIIATSDDVFDTYMRDNFPNFDNWDSIYR